MAVALIAGWLAGGHPALADPPRVSADAAVLMDAETGQVLYAKNPHKRRAPASTTKIMTTILALEMAELTDVVVVDPRAASVEVGSDVGLRAGDRLTLEDLLKASLIGSANDAAVAVADHAGGSVDLFADLMTRKARILGARNTNFVNPNGYSKSQHYSTAYDLALITRYALLDERFSEIVGTREDRVTWLNREHYAELENTNHLLKTYDGADGVKTGTTRAAGECLVASATRQGRRLIAVVLRSHSRFGEAASLLDHGFQNFYRWRLGAGELFTLVPVQGGETNHLKVVVERTVQTTVPLEELGQVEQKVTLDRHPPVPVRKGQVLGEVVLYVAGSEVGRTPLVAGEEVKRRPWWKLDER
ncbi:hypothetical protein SY88_08050 [Clostridiales bacterium PH28_bin88]|nr:hypothetical protein SY88_08050 [Clostridiales bacterium PH28_bin88]